MGQEILYCNKCGVKLHGDDFTRGRAHTIENRQYCQKCVSIHLTPAKKADPPKAEPPPRTPAGTSRMKMASPTPRPMPLVPPAPKSRAMIYVGLIVVAATSIGVVVLIPRTPAPSPAPVAVPPHPPEADPAQAAREKEKLSQELKDLETKIGPLLKAEQFEAVTALLEEARKRRDVPEWTGPVARRITEVQELPAGIYLEVKRAAVAAQARGASVDAQQLRTRVAAWGRKDLLQELDLALKAVVPREPLPPGAKALMKFPDEGPVRYRLLGEMKDGALQGRQYSDHVNMGFESGKEICRLGDAGEVRLTYSTTSRVRIQVTLRATMSDGKNHPFHFWIDPAEPGRPLAFKMATSKVVDANSKPLEKGDVINNIYVRQEGAATTLMIYDFVVLSTKD